VSLIDLTKFDASMLAMMGESGAPVSLFSLDTSRHLDGLIADSYRDSPTLEAMVTALKNDRAWPPELKPRLRIPFAECELVAARIYFRKRLIIDPDDSELQL
jgi:hypothetical protein